ncbi:aminotransferase-like domain-containing protein [Paenibacillus alginolyticus]|uniref:PLP-dependent aminotransferase family protein n=1 Tax=Paenibacillus alginolyticus TaxID=59839 RepID=A0ABT4GET2_9BACL|nr:PLP-dependent aminotransferase family protein [Paenibacillus alginolyticus]MCY9694688.1 PLP-dependent aminotransferase family protein [Paenibacillus alginolyticus]MEC0148028.1 PLP-dependent aminotransferase family protein [Paenibacillus alginolyticus]
MHKYSHIFNDIERQIENGHIRSGQKLPSIRELSITYSCNKSTVIRAYTELEKRHLIYSIPQSGYYAVQKRTDAFHPAEHLVYDFSSGAPDPELFPYLDFKHCINKAIDTYKNDLFVYGTPQGLPSLLKVLTKHLANYQVFTNPSNIHVTSGVQQALSVLALMPFPNGKRGVLLEQPSYYLFIRLLEMYQIPAFGITRTASGIDLDELERIFRTEDIKFFYTMPRFHNPLGSSYSEQTKKAIAQLAKRYDVYIVEDDYLADLENDTKSDPIFAYASNHVVYLKSYSKILFPGLRVGAAVLPTDLTLTFSNYKKLSDIDSSMLSQAALEIYIQSGMFERRKRKIRDSYSRRLMHLNKSLLANSDTAYLSPSEVTSGVYTHIIVPAHLHIPTLLDRLRKKRVTLQNLEDYYLPAFGAEHLLSLSVTQVSEERIEAGVRLIADEIKRMLG